MIKRKIYPILIVTIGALLVSCSNGKSDKLVEPTTTTKQVLQALGANAESQKINFSKSWTFLKLGMGLEDDEASAVLANWFVEGQFSETNRQNTEKNKAIDDSDSYEFYYKDEIGFGIMQWTYFSRKEDLQDIAGEMESGVGNINVQFATFKYEVNNVYPYKTHWPTVKNANSIEKMTTIFMKEIEQPKDQGSDAQKSRIEKAKIIFKGMGEINE